MSKTKKTKLYVKGMHCPSCEVLMRDSFGSLKNVRSVKADHTSQTVTVEHTGELNTQAVVSKIKPFGYSIEASPATEQKQDMLGRVTDLLLVGVTALFVYVLSKVLQFDMSFSSISNNLSLPGAFVLGLVASTSTCMATSGALFLATVGKMRRSEDNFVTRLIPAVSFNVGRVLAYAAFGVLTGFVGRALTQQLQMGPAVTFSVAVFMILVGLDMAGIIRLSKILPTGASGRLFEFFEHRLIKHPKKTAFFLGVITYFLPCGFTQAVQAYSLGLADPLKSSLTMTVFALGTVPALLALGFLQSSVRSNWYPYLQKLMGAVILVFGISYFGNFLSLYGINFAFSKSAASTTEAVAKPEMKDGYQIMRMKVNGYGYTPDSFTIQKGIPTKWIIDGENVFGCQAALTSPQLGVQKVLTAGENVIEFTPDTEGPLAFSCSMGMYRGTINVVNNF